GVDGGGRADQVHQRHREQGGCAGAPGEVDAVEVRQGAQHVVRAGTVDGEVAGDLGVGVLVADVERAGEVAQERHVGHGGDEVGHEPGDGEGDAAALAAALRGHARGVDAGEGAHG